VDEGTFNLSRMESRSGNVMAVQLVAIVFTDLVRSTALKSLLPGNDVDERNQSYVRTIEEPHRQRIEVDLLAAGGRIVKNTGDGFLLVFGQVAQAARWCVTLMRSHFERPIATPLGALELKIGLHVGAPLPNPHDPGDYIGQEIDFAARLCAGAARGQLLVSEAAAALVRAAELTGVKIHGHGGRELKGIGIVPVFELLEEGQHPKPPALPALAPGNLPSPHANFVGRANLIDRIREHLRQGGMTVLKGEGGMGKTALAFKAARDAMAAGELPGGAAWINAELEPSLDECLRQTMRVFFGERTEHEPIEVCAARISEHLDQEDALLLLDNFETVVHNQELIRWLASLPPRARILITTREIPPGLPGRVVAVEELSDEEARALFMERAARGGAVTTGQESVIDMICAAVGCQPLAIELLAARAALAPLSRLLERVLKSPAVIDAKQDPTRPDRHRSAISCIELSFKELRATAIELLRRLCIFPAGASGAIITAVMASQDWDDAAEELVAASVWRLSGRRYTMHPLVRQVALEDLGQNRGETEHHAALAVTKFICLRNSQAPARQELTTALKSAIDWVEAELPNLSSVVGFAFAAGEWESVLNLTTAIFNFFQVRGHWTEAEPLYAQALEAARHSGNRSGEARTLNFLGLIYRQQGRWAEAETAHRNSLEIWREVGEKRGVGHTLKHLGRIVQLRQRYGESAVLCEQALELLREVADALGEAKALAYLGNVYRFDGRHEEATAVYQQALEISRAIGDRYDEGEILRRLGQIHHRQGHHDQAKEDFQKSLTIWRGFDDRYNEAVILDNLGALFRDMARYSEAEAMLGQSLAAFRQCGDRRKQGVTLLNLAKLNAARGDRAAALDLGTQAVAIFEQTEDSWLLERARELLQDLKSGVFLSSR
jgi:tetratricopeptide (TPR) repeat protein/class 3 adenylate cyclase